MTASAKLPSNLGRIRRFLGNPWMGGVGSLAGIIGLFAAGYFYYASIRYPGLAFYVQQVKTAIVSEQQLSDLRVFYQGRQVHDVTAVQLAVWNAGNQPIKPEDVLDTARIQIQPPEPILKVNVIKASRGVVKFSFGETEFSQGTVPLSWKILEQGDGALLQIVYAGPTRAEISVMGTIVGQRKILGGSTAKLPSRFDYLFSVVFSSVMLICALFVGNIVLFVDQTFRDRAVSLIFIAALLSCVAYNFYSVWSPVAPPFSF